MTLAVNGNSQNETSSKVDQLKTYPGGSLQIKIKPADTQRNFVWRGFYEHAKAAGLSHEASAKFADQWATDKLQYQQKGKIFEYTDKEFAGLKKKGATNSI